MARGIVRHLEHVLQNRIEWVSVILTEREGNQLQSEQVYANNIIYHRRCVLDQLILHMLMISCLSS